MKKRHKNLAFTNSLFKWGNLCTDVNIMLTWKWNIYVHILFYCSLQNTIHTMEYNVHTVEWIWYIHNTDCIHSNRDIREWRKKSGFLFGLITVVVLCIIFLDISQFNSNELSEFRGFRTKKKEKKSSSWLFIFTRMLYQTKRKM